jgi:hypothetical protein
MNEQTECHYLVVKACEHKDCDGPKECPGWDEYDWHIECASGEDANCRWMCDPCGEMDGEWHYNGNGTCWHDHQMTKCPCLIIDWFKDGSYPLDEVVSDPIIGRHEITPEWDSGYTACYTTAVSEA